MPGGLNVYALDPLDRKRRGSSLRVPGSFNDIPDERRKSSKARKSRLGGSDPNTQRDGTGFN